MGFKISASKICFLSLSGDFYDVIVDGYSVVRIGVMVLNISFIIDNKKFSLLLLFTTSIIVISLLVKKFSFSYV